MCRERIAPGFGASLAPSDRWKNGDVDELALDGGATKSGWSVILDTVMGGSSRGTLSREGSSIAFQGTLSERGGGFAAARRALPDVDLTEFSGLLIDFEGSAEYPQTWEVGLTDSSGYRFGAAAVVPIGGPRVKLFLPWTAFQRAGRWGRRCSSCTLNRAAVSELAFYLLYQESDFRLLVHSVQAVRVPAGSTHPRVQLDVACTHLLARRTISRGVHVWNKDYKELCAAMYESSLRSIAEGAADSAHRAVACRALNFVAGDPSTAAWAHRRALDAILDSEGQTSIT